MWPFGDIEFVIDETPVPVAEPSVRDGGSDAASDFFGQLAELLAEYERLTVATRLLEQERGGGDEIAGLIKRVLPVLDGFERLLEMGRGAPDDPVINNWLRSIESLYFRFKGLLEKYGLFGIEVVGQPVNLDLHEVVEYRHSPDHEPDTVIAVRQRGYVFRGRLIRDAQVVVARG